MRSRVLRSAVPDADHVLARAPLLILGKTEPDNRPTLGSDEVLARDADSPAEPSRLCHDLIERVHGFRSADPGDRLHVFAVLEKLHTERDRPQPQQALEVGNQFRPIVFHNSSFGRSCLETLAFLGLSFLEGVLCVFSVSIPGHCSTQRFFCGSNRWGSSSLRNRRDVPNTTFSSSICRSRNTAPIFACCSAGSLRLSRSPVITWRTSPI